MEEKIDIDLFNKYCSFIDERVAAIARIKGYNDPRNYINWYPSDYAIHVEVSWSSWGCSDGDSFYVTLSEINEPDSYFEEQRERELEEERVKEEARNTEWVKMVQESERLQYERLKQKFENDTN